MNMTIANDRFDPIGNSTLQPDGIVLQSMFK